MFHTISYKNQYIHISQTNIEVQLIDLKNKNGCHIIRKVKSLHAAKCLITKFNKERCIYV